MSNLCDIFTSAAPLRETGYNEFGTCVPKIHPAKFSWVLDAIKAQSEAKAAAAAAAERGLALLGAWGDDQGDDLSDDD